jgi:hypothetical protein
MSGGGIEGCSHIPRRRREQGHHTVPILHMSGGECGISSITVQETFILMCAALGSAMPVKESATHGSQRTRKRSHTTST